MYKYFDLVKGFAENISGLDTDGSGGKPGGIENLEMKEWYPGKYRIQFAGKTMDGEEFELTLEVSKCQKAE